MFHFSGMAIDECCLACDFLKPVIYFQSLFCKKFLNKYCKYFMCLNNFFKDLGYIWYENYVTKTRKITINYPKSFVTTYI